MNNTQIQEAIDKNKIVLFMKGTRNFPQCGFSGRIVKILEQYNAEYQEYDVLEDSELRDGIKSFSDWPTIPQLYVNGEFVGGSDIVYDMYKDGTIEEARRMGFKAKVDIVTGIKNTIDWYANSNQHKRYNAFTEKF